MSERRRVFVGSGYALMSTIVALMTAVVLRPIMVRSLGIRDFGVLILATTLQGIFSLVADLGFGSAVTKFVAEALEESRRKELVSTSIVASFVSGLVPSVLLTIAALPSASLFGMPALSSVMLVLAWQAPFAFASTTCLASLSGLRQMRTYGAGSAFTSFCAFLFVLAPLLLGFGLIAVCAGMLAASVVNLFVLVWTLRGNISWTRGEPFFASIRKLVRFGIQMSVTNAAGVILYLIDTMLLGFFTRSDTLVGYYGLSTLLARSLWVIPGSISIVAYPAIAEYNRDGMRSRTQAFADRAVRFSAGIVGIGVISLGYFGREIIEFLFGFAAAAAYVPLAILLVGCGILGVAKSITTGISSVGRPEVSLKVALVGLGASIVLNAFLIPIFGIFGAAMATTVAYSMTGALFLLNAQKVLAVKIAFNWLLKASLLIGSLVLPLIVLLIFGSSYEWIRLPGGMLALIAFGAMLYWRMYDPADREFVRSTIQESISGPLGR